MTPLSILLVLISALIHSSWNFFTKRGNWPIEFFFWVFLWGTLLYLPLFIGLGTFPSLLLDLSPVLWSLVALSSFFETVYFISLIKAYQGADLSLVYPISRSAPIFTQFFAIFFIGEVLSPKGFIGIGLVMVGLFALSLRAFPYGKTASIPAPGLESRSYLLALVAALTSSIYSVIDKIGVQMIHPVYYLWLINLGMSVYTGIYLCFRKERPLWKTWRESKKETLLISLLQNAAYLLILLALQVSQVSYVVAFRQVGALLGAVMGIVFLKERNWMTRLTGALILTAGLVLIGLA